MTGAAVSGNVCVCPHGLHDSPTGYVRASLSWFFFLADLSPASCETRDGVAALPIHVYNFKLRALHGQCCAASLFSGTGI